MVSKFISKQLLTRLKTYIHCVHSDVQTTHARFKGVMCSMNNTLVIILSLFFISTNSYATRGLCTVIYLHPDTFEVKKLENGEIITEKKNLNEKEKYDRKVFFDKVEVVMKYLKIEYDRLSDTEMCTLSKVNISDRNEILGKVNDSNWLEKMDIKPTHNKNKNLHSLRSFGRAKSARPF